MENGKIPQRRWFSAKEAAEYLGINLRTLYNYTKKRKNRPPFVRLNGKSPYRFPREQFIQWSEGPQG